MTQDLVTHHTQADTARERLRLWRTQRLFAAAVAAATVGGIWLSAMGAGAAGAAATIVAGLAPTAVATPLAAWAAGRLSRRALLSGAPMVLAAAVLACELASPEIGVGAVVACVAVVGAARAAFDGATADLLHHLTQPARRVMAHADLTARFGGGTAAAGLAGALLVGLVAGPHGAIALGGVLAAAASLVAVHHHPDIDLRPQSAPLWRALAAAVRVVADDRLLRRIVLTGAWSTAVGAAQATVLIVWLRDGVGLRGALVPALLGGFVAMRLGRPLVLRLAGRARPGTVLTTALAVQASASLAAYSAHGSLGAASAYALSLAAGASLGILVNRALAAASPPELAPAVGLASGAAWALAACAGAAAGAGLAAGLGLAGTHLALAALAILGAVAVATRAAAQVLVPARRGA